jgi:23S rRNA (uracil1939-C5)-methyltransferase
METITLTLTAMANGGAAFGRDAADRVIFVPFAIPGERVEVTVIDDKKHFAQARLVRVLAEAADRVAPRCPHFGDCGGCQFQHIDYPAQLRFKEAVIKDQMARIGGLQQVPLRHMIANPAPWQDAIEVNFDATADGQPGFWFPTTNQVTPIETCYLIRPELVDFYRQVDLQLPDLRHLRLRLGDGGACMAALETTGVEPPDLETDMPVSVTLLLPDGTAANLIGDNYLVQSVKGRDFRVSAGCYFPPSPAVTGQLIDTVLGCASLSGREQILELYSGVGTLTAFLAPQAAEIIAVERNEDAAADAAVNLDEFDNVSLYVGLVEEILPLLEIKPDLVIADPPSAGLGPAAVDGIVATAAPRLIYISSDVATLARDGRSLTQAGYRLVELQPIDMFPQTYRCQIVSLWQAAG